MPSAFDEIRIGRHTARNRVVMAPMTRSRAYGPGASPTELMARYYGQRAGAGLIITEGTQPSAVGQGYLNTPGLHTATQVEAWKPVTAAVHERGGLIFAQLMHSGRIGHPSLHGATPVGASPVAAAGTVFTAEGPQDLVTPEPLDEDGIRATIADFTAAARNAIEAGFDGVELHSANGYLLHQFLSTNANLRTDGWGGTVEGRIRLTVEVTKAVAAAIGADRLGVRISPSNPFNDITEDGHRETYLALVDALNPLGLAYLHVAEGPDTEFTPRLRERWSGTLILNPYTPGAWTGPEALKAVENGEADAVSYGALFLANPDLPERLAAGGPFQQPDYAKAYGGDHSGYTDYPALADA
ncbi:alkene reductase [Actinoplanes sp. NBRC 14428]|uniref:N-ethylmaleimide reductase n=1 Tax=Pseudosporangium ferrugineum TaxID=439699 RepID=A0A2T0SJM8_9ACTN|nr:alkene reductase [Pseudosporangium ferrugineum]PRY33626.1 N-ethylmaleimide reductase [Pseudosporangium ferrugineum]BCJ56421.1 alkene reductase [Actinoplanes sp. NBRC 14428]